MSSQRVLYQGNYHPNEPHVVARPYSEWLIYYQLERCYIHQKILKLPVEFKCIFDPDDERYTGPPLPSRYDGVVFPEQFYTMYKDSTQAKNQIRHDNTVISHQDLSHMVAKNWETADCTTKEYVRVMHCIEKNEYKRCLAVYDRTCAELMRFPMAANDNDERAEIPKKEEPNSILDHTNIGLAQLNEMSLENILKVMKRMGNSDALKKRRVAGLDDHENNVLLTNKRLKLPSHDQQNPTSEMTRTTTSAGISSCSPVLSNTTVAAAVSYGSSTATANPSSALQLLSNASAAASSSSTESASASATNNIHRSVLLQRLVHDATGSSSANNNLSTSLQLNQQLINSSVVSRNQGGGANPLVVVNHNNARAFQNSHGRNNANQADNMTERTNKIFPATGGTNNNNPSSSEPSQGGRPAFQQKHGNANAPLEVMDMDTFMAFQRYIHADSRGQQMTDILKEVMNTGRTTNGDAMRRASVVATNSSTSQDSGSVASMIVQNRERVENSNTSQSGSVISMNGPRPGPNTNYLSLPSLATTSTESSASPALLEEQTLAIREEAALAGTFAAAMGSSSNSASSGLCLSSSEARVGLLTSHGSTGSSNGASGISMPNQIDEGTKDGESKSFQGELSLTNEEMRLLLQRGAKSIADAASQALKNGGAQPSHAETKAAIKYLEIQQEQKHIQALPPKPQQDVATSSSSSSLVSRATSGGEPSKDVASSSSGNNNNPSFQLDQLSEEARSTIAAFAAAATAAGLRLLPPSSNAANQDPKKEATVAAQNNKARIDQMTNLEGQLPASSASVLHRTHGTTVASDSNQDANQAFRAQQHLLSYRIMKNQHMKNILVNHKSQTMTEAHNGAAEVANGNESNNRNLSRCAHVFEEAPKQHWFDKNT